MEDLTDEQLLSCPEAIEPTFIHRGRRDSISTQAGKEKQKNRSKCCPIYHQTAYQSISTAIIAKRFSLQLQKFGLSSFFFSSLNKGYRGSLVQIFGDKRPGLLLYILINLLVTCCHS